MVKIFCYDMLLETVFFFPIDECFLKLLLLADYNMLEDVKRVAESAKRMRQKLCGYSHFRLPLHLKNLLRAASDRRTKILFLSSGMSRRLKNQTYYNERFGLVELACALS